VPLMRNQYDSTALLVYFGYFVGNPLMHIDLTEDEQAKSQLYLTLIAIYCNNNRRKRNETIRIESIKHT
jgi:hypothetical protein